MSYIGKQPTKAPLTASDIEDGIITAAKIEDGAVVAAEIASNAVTTAKINADAVTSAKIADNAISEEHLDATVVTGLTALEAEPADTDEFIVSDAGTLKRIDYSHIKGGVEDGAITKAKLADQVDIFAGTSLTAADLGSGIHVRTADSGATASSLADELVIENSSDTGITILSGTSSASSIHFGDSGDNDIGKIVYDHGTGTLTANAMAFYTAGNEVARFDAAGKLRLLHGDFGATPSSSNKGFEFRPNGSNGGTLDCAITATSNHTIINFDNGNGGVGTIQMNGSATAYNTSSDYRLKENVNYTWDATTRLKQLKPARFNFIADEDTTVDGFIAHEVSSVVPEAISGEKDAVREDGSIQPQGIDQSKLVPLLVKTIQELEVRIKTLEDA